MNVLSCGTFFYYAIQSESVDKSYGETIQMKLRYWAILFCGTVYFVSVDEILWSNHSDERY